MRFFHRLLLNLRRNEKQAIRCEPGEFKYASKSEVEKATKDIIKKYKYDLKELAKH